MGLFVVFQVFDELFDITVFRFSVQGCFQLLLCNFLARFCIFEFQTHDRLAIHCLFGRHLLGKLSLGHCNPSIHFLFVHLHQVIEIILMFWPQNLWIFAIFTRVECLGVSFAQLPWEFPGNGGSHALVKLRLTLFSSKCKAGVTFPHRCVCQSSTATSPAI